MKAIVLSYDPQACLAELVFKTYQDCWPGCPLVFHVPRNNPGCPSYSFLARQKNVRLVATRPDIRSTMASLLAGSDDQEWVYWCVNDRYPLSVDVARINNLFHAIASGDLDDLNIIRAIHWKDPLTERCRDIRGMRFQYREAVVRYGLWHHQFCKAHVLKSLFLTDAHPQEYRLHEVFKGIQQLTDVSMMENAVVPVDGPLIGFGETMDKGVLTVNAAEALEDHGCPKHDLKVGGFRMVFSGSHVQAAPPQEKTTEAPIPKRFKKSLPKKIYTPIRRQLNRVFNKFAAIEERPRVNLLVCSFGGVASKCLVRGLLATPNNDLLNAAHTHVGHLPSDAELGSRKLIYIFGDPRNAIISFFRRKIFHTALHGFHAEGSRLGKPYWAHRHLMNLNKCGDELPPDWSLKDYLENGHDLFRLNDHFKVWSNDCAAPPRMIVRSDTMWDHLDEIFDYCGIERHETRHFPLRQKRGSDWMQLPRRERDQLNEIYGDLVEVIKEHPDLRVIDAGTG